MLEEGFKGTTVTRVLVEKLVDIAAQFYAAISLDRSAGTYLAMVSNEGGVDIEEVARTTPDAIRRARRRGAWPAPVPCAPTHGPPAAEAREGAAGLLTQAYDVLVTFDATLVELNPFVLLTNGTVMALDAKVTVDDNALFRQPDVAALADSFPVDPVEQRAKDAGLQYVKLDGEVGDHRQRRWARDVHARRREAGGGRRGELPRRGRRRGARR